MGDRVISIAEDYSRFPAGRYSSDGPFSGERFRNEFLGPAIVAAQKDGGRVIVLLDDVWAYSSSFLEEAFGGLVREHKGSADQIKRILEIRASDLAYQPAKIDAERYIDEEIKQKRR